MIQPRVVAGLSLLCALLFCAFTAQTASAAKAINTTAVTCVPEPNKKGDFTDEHCDTASPEKIGGFTHAAIENGKTTEVELTNEKVTEATKKSEPAVLKGTVALVKTEIECATAKGKGTFTNQEPILGQHTGSGSGSTEMSKCTVKAPTKCSVKEPILVEVTGTPVEGLTGPKEEKNAMGGEVVGKGEKETFTSIEFQGTECALKNKIFIVQGSAIVTSGPTTESNQTGKSTGATAVYTPKFSMQKLTFGASPAEFSLITTVRRAPIEGKVQNPISATTTT
jgi:hypothetical protein